MTMATKVGKGNVRPRLVRDEPVDSITARQKLAAVSVTDLRAEVKRRRRLRWRKRFVMVGCFLVAVAVAVALVWACGKGERR